MKEDFYSKLQDKFGGMWVATSKAGRKVYAAAKRIEELYKSLARKRIRPQETVIGYIEKEHIVNVYPQISLPSKDN